MPKVAGNEFKNQPNQRRSRWILFLILATGGLWGSGGLAVGLAATWHVAPAGSDRASGQVDAPFATLDRAETAAEPGDEILLHTGRHHTGRGGFRARKAGEAGRPIILRAENPGSVVLTTGETLAGFEPYRGHLYRAKLDRHPSAAVQDGDPLYHRWEMPFTGPDDPNLQRGGWHWAEGYFYLWPWDNEDPRQHRIVVSFSSVVEVQATCSHRVWEGLVFEHGSYGLHWNSRDARHHEVRNCVFRNASNGIGGAPDTLIEHCTFHNLGPSTWEHGIYDGHENTVIRYNHFERIAGGGVHLYKTPVAATVCHNSFGPPMTDRVHKPGQVGLYVFGRGHQVHHNVIYGGHRIGMDLTAPDCLVSENTIVGTTVAGLLVAGDPKGTRVTNNLVVAAGGLAVEARKHPEFMDGNVYAGPGEWKFLGRELKTFAAWQQISGADRAGVWMTKCLFADSRQADFRLAPATVRELAKLRRARSADGVGRGPGAVSSGKAWPPTGVNFVWQP